MISVNSQSCLSLGRIGSMSLFIVLILLTPPAIAYEWQIEYVEDGKQFSEMTDRSLRLDAQGNPHVAYGQDHLYYAWFTGTNWSYETVDHSLGGGGTGAHASLCLDCEGRPHISYQANGELNYAYRDDSNWHVDTVDGGESDIRSTSLAIDEDGFPHISYQICHYGNHANKDLRYAYKDHAGWHVEIADSLGNVGRYTSLELDESGFPHISYYDSDNRDLKYAYKQEAGWHIETVDAGLRVGEYSSIALGGADSPHISYYDRDNDALKYAHRVSSGWQFETVPTEDDIGWWTSLALDAEGFPRISCGGVFGLTYALKDAWGWHIQTVDYEGHTAGFTSLAIDSCGRSHISYFNSLSHSLKYACRQADGWSIHTIDKEKSVGLYTSLAMDAEGLPCVSYYEGIQCELKYAHRSTSGWLIEIVDSDGNVGRYTSLELDTEEAPHISYHQSYPDYDLKYAHKGASGWETETVDSEGEVGFWTSLALDGYGCPCISYYDQTNESLKCAYSDGFGWWYTETVDSPLGWASSCLVLDSTGRPHISYNGGEGLTYAFKDDSGWHIEIVSDIWAPYTALALDANGYPHISYYYDDPESFWGSLSYAFKDDSGWHIHTVDMEGDVGLFPALAIDGGGRSHVSYGENVSSWSHLRGDDLKYACKDDSGWHIEIADSLGSVGLFSSLALDSIERPHITYCAGYYSYGGDVGCDLRYAYTLPAATQNDPDRVLPGNVSLLGICPNPASTHASILYTFGAIPSSENRHISLRIYDTLGRLVAMPVARSAPSETHSIRWNLRTDGGNQVPSGVYYLRIQTENPEAVDSERLIVIR